MSENILSLEDLKFLELLHSKYGVQFLRFDDEGIQTSHPDTCNTDHMKYLSEISKKLKFRLNSNIQLNFKNNFSFDVVKI